MRISSEVIEYREFTIVLSEERLDALEIFLHRILDKKEIEDYTIVVQLSELVSGK